MRQIIKEQLEDTKVKHLAKYLLKQEYNAYVYLVDKDNEMSTDRFTAKPVAVHYAKVEGNGMHVFTVLFDYTKPDPEYYISDTHFHSRKAHRIAWEIFRDKCILGTDLFRFALDNGDLETGAVYKLYNTKSP